MTKPPMEVNISFRVSRELRDAAQAKRIAAPVHFAMPYKCAGSETVLHLLLRALTDAGHEVCCWATHHPEAPPVSEFEGIEIRCVRRASEMLRDVRLWNPDVVVSHHQHAAMLFRYFRYKRTVYLTHNDMDVNRNALRQRPTLVVHNSQWVADSLRRYGESPRSLVLYPPLDCERHRVEQTGDAVTMVNMNEHKGAHVFYALADRMPDVQFLAVLGGHGEQVIEQRPNVEIVEHAPDLRPVWRRTAVVVMPSIYESFGLVPAEAGCSGIPSVTAPTPGLVESRGSAGIHVDRDDLDGWEKTLRRLLEDPAIYRIASVDATRRSRELCRQSEGGLARVVREIESLMKDSTS